MPEDGEILEDSKPSAKSDGNVTAITNSGATEGLNNADSWGGAPTDVPRIVQIPFDPGGLSPDVIYPEKPEQKWLDEISTQQMKEHCTTTVDKLGIEIVCNNNISPTINNLDDCNCREFFIDSYSLSDDDQSVTSECSEYSNILSVGNAIETFVFDHHMVDINISTLKSVYKHLPPS